VRRLTVPVRIARGRSRTGRAARILTTVTLCVGVALPTTAASAATPTPAATFIADINASRAARHLHALKPASDLTAVALAWAKTMAKHKGLSHNPKLPTVVQHWQGLAENVGMGQTVPQLHYAFMHSPPHKANILNPSYTQIGIGVVVVGHEVYVVEDFRRPS
jgi:uncharacterized protein YkwD